MVRLELAITCQRDDSQTHRRCHFCGLLKCGCWFSGSGNGMNIWFKGSLGDLTSWVVSHSFLRWLDPSHPFSACSTSVSAAVTRSVANLMRLAGHALHVAFAPKNDGFRKNLWQVSWTKELWNQGSFADLTPWKWTVDSGGEVVSVTIGFWMFLDVSGSTWFTVNLKYPEFMVSNKLFTLSAAWSAIPWLYLLRYLNRDPLSSPPKKCWPQFLPIVQVPTRELCGCLSFPTPPSASDCHQVAALWVWSTAARAWDPWDRHQHQDRCWAVAPGRAPGRPRGVAAYYWEVSGHWKRAAPSCQLLPPWRLREVHKNWKLMEILDPVYLRLSKHKMK